MEERVNKKGYSIWSLLVVMTLLAVWLAVPRTLSIGKLPEIFLVFFIVLHQITFWVLIGCVIGLVSGRLRVAIGLLVVIPTIFGVLATAERYLFHSEYVSAWTLQTGLVDVLQPIYKAIAEAFTKTFTYGPH